jgi:hypothetical protein
MNNKFITLRTVITLEQLCVLLSESEFRHNTSLHAKADSRLNGKPMSDHFFAVFVFDAVSKNDGSLVLRVISTTVVGIQRYTTKRLGYQGIFPQEKAMPLVMDTLRAHFRAEEEDLRDRLKVAFIGGRSLLRWTKDFVNGAGDLADPPEFIIKDPDLADLERLFSERATDPGIEDVD